MTILQQLAAVALAGAITENLLFARALGVNKVVTRSKGYREILVFGVLFCFAVSLGGLFGWTVRGWFENIPWWGAVRGFAVLLCVCSAYFVMVAVIGVEHVKSVKSAPVAVAFNSAAFGAVFLAIENHSALPDVLAYCAGCSLGITFAMLLVHSGRERIEMSRVPPSFQGIPITMIYIGILSLAFYGLLGHRLPT